MQHVDYFIEYKHYNTIHEFDDVLNSIMLLFIHYNEYLIN